MKTVPLRASTTLALSLLSPATSLLHASAQQSHAAPARTAHVAPSSPSPTMKQTIDFINESFAQQGDVFTTFLEKKDSNDTQQTVHLEGSCSLLSSHTHEFRIQDTLKKSASRELLHLDRSDPFSVSVAADTAHETAYYIAIDKAVLEFRPLELPADTPAEALPANYDFVQGFVRSISGRRIFIVSIERKLVIATLDDNVEVTQNRMPITVADIAIGDWVSGSRSLIAGRYSQNFSVFKNVSSFQKYRFGVFADKNLAEHVAKALIHAMVLCHKDDTSALF